MVWTNDDLGKLHNLGLISIVGRDVTRKANIGICAGTYMKTEDPEWYTGRHETAR